MVANSDSLLFIYHKYTVFCYATTRHKSYSRVCTSTQNGKSKRICKCSEMFANMVKTGSFKWIFVLCTLCLQLSFSQIYYKCTKNLNLSATLECLISKIWFIIVFGELTRNRIAEREWGVTETLNDDIQTPSSSSSA